MQYRQDQKNGNKLSILGLGCMRFPRGINTRIDMNKAEEIICEAIEGGVNYLDTAYVYGGSEEATGEILHKRGLREKVYLATKLPHQKCKSYEDFDRIFDEQLERLKTNYIDYYLIHNISDAASWDRLKDLGIEQWIKAKQEKGAIKNIGFSFHGAQAGFLELLDVYDWDFTQIQYNYMNETDQAGRVGLQAAYEKGLMIIIMEPLLGGKLANNLPKKITQVFNAVDPTKSAVAWALNWIWNQPEATVILSGMSTVEQVRENVQIAQTAVPGMLNEQESAALDTAIELFRAADKIPCTGCNYCMPCPHGVNIPGCLAAYNTRCNAGLVAGMTQYVVSTGINRPEKAAGPTNCTQCGLCEKACPQQIKIASELVVVKKKMEPFWFSIAMKIIKKAMS